MSDRPHPTVLEQRTLLEQRAVAWYDAWAAYEKALDDPNASREALWPVLRHRERRLAAAVRGVIALAAAQHAEEEERNR
jgi:hypothetical protein